MDELARFNQQRWDSLAKANVLYSRPWLNLDAASARRRLDPSGVAGDVAGKDVLCLAGGGGQQSAAFALLGANVTVLDLTPTQLERDWQAAAHYGHTIRIIQGDMRDLSGFDAAGFDIVWHAHSLSFIPKPHEVFAGVARVLRPGGLYHLHCANPFAQGVTEQDWNGQGYVVHRPYVDEAEVVYADDLWDAWLADGSRVRVPGPCEFLHTMSTLVNGLVEHGFVIFRLDEDCGDDPDKTPGSWAHFMTVMAPWLTFWTRLRPDLRV